MLQSKKPTSWFLNHVRRLMTPRRTAVVCCARSLRMPRRHRTRRGVARQVSECPQASYVRSNASSRMAGRAPDAHVALTVATEHLVPPYARRGGKTEFDQRPHQQLISRSCIRTSEMHHTTNKSRDRKEQTSCPKTRITYAMIPPYFGHAQFFKGHASDLFRAKPLTSHRLSERHHC